MAEEFSESALSVCPAKTATNKLTCIADIILNARGVKATTPVLKANGLPDNGGRTHHIIESKAQWKLFWNANQQ